MKKFISMVMAAAMVVSLVPATAFAATDVSASAKILRAKEWVEDEHSFTNYDAKAPEVQIKVNSGDYATTELADYEINLKLDNAKFTRISDHTAPADADELEWLLNAENDKGAGVGTVCTENHEHAVGTCASGTKYAVVAKIEDAKNMDEITLTYIALDPSANLKEDYVLTIPVIANVEDTDEGEKATVTVKSKDLGLEKTELTFVEYQAKGIALDIDDTTDVAPEEIATIENVEVELTVGDAFTDIVKSDEFIKLKLSKGFEFKYINNDDDSKDAMIGSTLLNSAWYDEDEIEIPVSSVTSALAGDELLIKNLVVEATDAKAGDVATLTVKFGDVDSQKIEVAKAVAEGVVFSVDADEDVPVMWSGVNAANYGLNADDDEHKALKVNFKETFKGALSSKDEFELTLPEGVYVTDIDFTDEDGTVTYTYSDDLEATFAEAYKEGEHKSFIFERREFITDESTAAIEFDFEMTLVADPGFVGDVVLGVVSDDIEETELTIAKFVSPMIVEAQQNDLKIDYRNTEVPTNVVVKEAEAGLWDKDTFHVAFGLDKNIDFEDDLVYTVNEDESDMEVDGKDGAMEFTLDKESDDEPGVVTISNISLYMDRNLAAGAYDLKMTENEAVIGYECQILFGSDCASPAVVDLTSDSAVAAMYDADGDFKACATKKDHHDYVGHVTDYSNVVKEAFVNIVTAGREQDDASFTTKVVVPVGESYIVAGEQTVALDVPAYVSAAGYTMLPVRAVAVALGINTNNVLWDQATKTVTILYGQRIITMTVGAKVINVNGSAIPASASVEIVNGRTFLPMRDLATALGVTDITWDAATKTATLNGNI